MTSDDRMRSTTGILVVGSTNLDLDLSVARHPQPGETVVAYDLRRTPGGKGANQACSAALQGGDVRFVTAIGDDADGDRALEVLRTTRADLSGVRRVADVPTGLAVVSVDAHGENSIVVAPGANATWSPLAIRALELDVSEARLVITQGELPPVAVDELSDVCARQGTRLLLNLAPVIPVEPQTIRRADPLVVNEYEGRLALNFLDDSDPSTTDDEDVVRRLRAHGVASVVMTRGARGALVSEGGILTDVAAPNVTAVDTTGAGDAFVGALAVSVARGESLADAAAAAVLVASAAVTRRGAQASYRTVTDPTA